MPPLVPTSALRSIALHHTTQESQSVTLPSNSASSIHPTENDRIQANLMKWQKFGVDISPYGSTSSSTTDPYLFAPVGAVHHGLQVEPPASRFQCKRERYEEQRPIKHPYLGEANWEAEFSCVDQHSLLDVCGEKVELPPTPHRNPNPGISPAKKRSSDTSAGYGACKELSVLLSQAEQEMRCGAPKSSSFASLPFKKKKGKNGKKTANSVEEETPKKSEEACKGKKSKAVKTKNVSKACAGDSSAAESFMGSTFFSQAGAAVAPTSGHQLHYEILTSHAEADELWETIRQKQMDPDRIQAPSLFAGVKLRNIGAKDWSNFTSWEMLRDAPESTRRPDEWLNLIEVFAFRWQDKMYQIVPEVGSRFMLRVLQELPGVEVVTYNAPFLIVLLLVASGESLATKCISDVRVMAWMSGSYASGVLTQYSQLQQAIFEHHRIPCASDGREKEFLYQVFLLAPMYRHLYAQLGSKGLLHSFLKQEKRVSILIAHMKLNGVMVHLEAVRALQVKYQKRMDAARSRAAELLGPSFPEFNIQSPDQCRIALYDHLQLGKHLVGGVHEMDRNEDFAEAVGLTKTGKLSTAEEALRLLAEYHELPQVILDYRKAAKIIQVYIDGMMQFAVRCKLAPEQKSREGTPSIPSIEDTPLCDLNRFTKGKSLVQDVSVKWAIIFPNFFHEGTDTGRLSCAEPNLQNLPRGTSDDMEADFRECFTAPDGSVLVSADYEQIELRVLAHLCGDNALIYALTNATDIHSCIAEMVYKKKDISSEERSIAKRVVFGTLYGAGAKTMAAQLHISPESAGQIGAMVQQSFPGVEGYRRQLLEEGRQHGFVRTLSGRLRYLPDLTSSQASQRSYAERQSFNTVVQGSAADVMKLAMLAVEERILLQYPSVKLLLQIHDELVLSVPHALLETIVPLLKEVMSTAVSLRVPLPVVAKYGLALGSLKPWTIENELGLFIEAPALIDTSAANPPKQ